MDTLNFTILLLFIAGLFIFLVGAILFFRPGLLVRWNALGNTWFGATERIKKHSGFTRWVFSVNYTVFTKHRVTGSLLMGLSLFFIVVYVIYH